MLETYHAPDVGLVSRFDTLKQAEKWLEKNKHKWEPELGNLYIGTNKKDGYVVYYFLSKTPKMKVTEYDPSLGLVTTRYVPRV